MWEKLKKILQLSGGRGVIMEDGEPRYVIIPVDEYLQLKEGSTEKVTETAKDPSGTGNNAGAYDYTAGKSEPQTPSGNAPIDLTDIDASDVDMDVDIYGARVQEASSRNISLEDLPINGN